METIFHSLSVPYSDSGRIEVYGDGEMGWYEWRIINNGKTTKDSANFRYGCPEIALRDALIWTTNDSHQPESKTCSYVELVQAIEGLSREWTENAALELPKVRQPSRHH